MKKLLILLAVSALSGAAGYQIGFLLTKKKYEGLADEEVDSVKEFLNAHYDKKLQEFIDSNGKQNGSIKKEEPKVKDNAPINTTKGKKKVDNGPIDYGKQYRTDSDPERIPGNPGGEIKHLKKEEVDTTKPYVITSEDFQDSEFECVSLFYTVDKVLTDDDYNQIDNIGIVGGNPVLEQMGRYDSDCLYVRDTKNGIDYEILLEERIYDKLKPLGVVGEE